MKISTKDLKNKRQWRSATGLEEDKFYKLLEQFKLSYIEVYGKELKARLVDSNIEYCIKNEEELLLFILISLKSGLNYDMLGLMCGMNASNAKRNQKTGVDLLNKTLLTLGRLPFRNFMTIKEFEDYFAGIDTIIIDATEQRIQRPKDKEEQKACYSGKKEQRTLKETIIATKDKVIRYLSSLYQGKIMIIVC